MWKKDLTDNQVELIKKRCDGIHEKMCKELETDPDNAQKQIEVCGWEQFCQNIGCKGYDYS